MEVFYLILDEKVVVWERARVAVEAETLEEAIQKCLDGDYDVDEAEVLYDTRQYLNPSPEHPTTTEVLDSTGYDVLYSNSINI